MPDYPYPGTAISPQYLRKTEGFKTPPDEGINHTAGLTKQGLDNATAGVVTAFSVSGLAATTATINWTTASLPGGTVLFMREGAQEQTYNEAAGPMTAHSAPLTGLTGASRYTYRIRQPSAAGAGAPVVYQSGVFTTA